MDWVALRQAAPSLIREVLVTASGLGYIARRLFQLVGDVLAQLRAALHSRLLGGRERFLCDLFAAFECVAGCVLRGVDDLVGHFAHLLVFDAGRGEEEPGENPIAAPPTTSPKGFRSAVSWSLPIC